MIDGFKLIGEALKDWLEAQTLSQAFTVQRLNHFAIQSEKVMALTVFVAPLDKTNTPGTRRSHEANYRYAIRSVKQIAKGTLAENIIEEDTLTKFVDELEESLASKKTLTVDGKDLALTLVTNDARLPMDWEAIREHKAFWGQLEVIIQAKS